MGFSRGSCVYQPFRPNVSHSTSYPLAILIQVKRDCGIPFFCSSNDGLCVGSASVVACSSGTDRSRASTSCQTHTTTLRPASTLARSWFPILLVSIIGAIIIIIAVDSYHDGIERSARGQYRLINLLIYFHSASLASVLRSIGT